MKPIQVTVCCWLTLRLPEYIFELNASDSELGQAVVDSLQKSRHLSIEEAEKVYAESSENYYKWVDRMKARFGYKTKQAMFKKMDSCDIELEEETIIIRPSHHERIECRIATKGGKADYVRVSADTPPEEIGSALRLAFSRCKAMSASFPQPLLLNRHLYAITYNWTFSQIISRTKRWNIYSANYT